MSDDDPMEEICNAFSEAERDVANLFAKISEKLSNDLARLIFTNILKQKRGRRATAQSQNIDKWIIGLYNAGVTEHNIIADWIYKHYKGKDAQSPDAIKKRIVRVLKKARDK